MHIRFSHRYPKVYEQRTAKLLHVRRVESTDLSEAFVEYDTVFFAPGNPPLHIGHYDLPSGPVLLLVFLGDQHIPFTTVRRWTYEKECYYVQNKGKVFDIIVAMIETEVENGR